MSGPLGFAGNSDLYGIGIRIGYYSQAISLWISHMWAPSEAYFLNPITLVFLVSVIIGVCNLSFQTSTTYAIEPFMIMQVAYYMYYMSFGGPHEYELLRWEVDYLKVVLTMLVGIGLHGFDTWFWWRGLYKFKPTPGEHTVALFVYFGQNDLYGYIRIVSRVWNAIALYLLVFNLVLRVSQRSLERTVNSEIPPSRLKEISQGWLTTLYPYNLNQTGSEKGDLKMPATLSPPRVSRRPSINSIRSAPVPNLTSEKSLGHRTTRTFNENWRTDLEKKTDFSTPGKAEDATSRNHSPIPQIVTTEPGIQRTKSDRFRERFLGWQPQAALGDPIYNYQPSLENLQLATDLIKDINKPDPHKKWRCITFIWDVPSSIIRWEWTLLTNKFRPRVLTAVTAHARSLSYTLEWIMTDVWRHAVNHPAYLVVSGDDIALASRIKFTLEGIRPPHRNRAYNKLEQHHRCTKHRISWSTYSCRHRSWQSGQSSIHCLV
ncbi:hypothetical protein BT63DRAFT_260511 [Microthyrium microscopicum]|uniref:Uncharacterized protein n=1 Tax=Microthyrium microscopicum TaxID=703497 RepID=A0A6A6UE93_9PEZI|nr:hypothetical protein BT63DRAFT_260511 [Microthyrium microscopicum]